MNVNAARCKITGNAAGGPASAADHAVAALVGRRSASDVAESLRGYSYHYSNDQSKASVDKRRRRSHCTDHVRHRSHQSVYTSNSVDNGHATNGLVLSQSDLVQPHGESLADQRGTRMDIADDCDGVGGFKFLSGSLSSLNSRVNGLRRRHALLLTRCFLKFPSVRNVGNPQHSILLLFHLIIYYNNFPLMWPMTLALHH
jgi:hypothetical protein